MLALGAERRAGAKPPLEVLAEAKALQDDAESARAAREDRLRGLGFEEPSPEQRKANLALNVALRKWPKN
ncbi:MAG: hypothetical protein B6D46_15115 [Polyangiaceae bacterium UTPRO1]|nr:MAG: hypothetical protein B6D46_15115 [Polyangiaceae bacterium UTPRO1]